MTNNKSFSNHLTHFIQLSRIAPPGGEQCNYMTKHDMRTYICGSMRPSVYGVGPKIRRSGVRFPVNFVFHTASVHLGWYSWYLVHKSKVGSIVLGCIGAHLARGKVMSVELHFKQLPLPLPFDSMACWDSRCVFLTILYMPTRPLVSIV